MTTTNINHVKQNRHLVEQNCRVFLLLLMITLVSDYSSRMMMIAREKVKRKRDGREVEDVNTAT